MTPKKSKFDISEYHDFKLIQYKALALIKGYSYNHPKFGKRIVTEMNRFHKDDAYLKMYEKARDSKDYAIQEFTILELTKEMTNNENFSEIGNLTKKFNNLRVEKNYHKAFQLAKTHSKYDKTLKNNLGIGFMAILYKKNQYEKAKTFMEEYRKKEFNLLLQNFDHNRYLYGYKEISKSLNQPEQNVLLYESLSKIYGEKEYWNIFSESIIKAKRYDIGVRMMENPLEEYEQLKQAIAIMKEVIKVSDKAVKETDFDSTITEKEKKEGEEMLEEMNHYSIKKNVEKIVFYIKVAQLQDTPKTAKKIKEDALTLFDSEEIRNIKIEG